MKSLLDSTEDAYRSVFQDAERLVPNYKSDRDFLRFCTLLKDRGLGLCTLDLCSLDQILLSGLESGKLSLSGPLTRSVSKRVRLPRFLVGIWSRIFNKDGNLLTDPCDSSIFILRQIFCLCKKLDLDCSPDRKIKEIEEYVTTDYQLRRPSLNWQGDELIESDSLESLSFDSAFIDSDLFGRISHNERFTDRKLLGRLQFIADQIASSIGEIDVIEDTLGCDRYVDGKSPTGYKHGPGAVSRMPKTKYKYDFENWPEKLNRVFDKEKLLVAYPTHTLLNHELPSRLIAVRKTAKSPRLIAAEPVEHQWCQQALSSVLMNRFYEAWGRGFINLSDQHASGLLVRRSSLDRSLATVDLSSASDRLTCWVVERAFRKNESLLKALHACRTRYTYIPDLHVHVTKQKFASQGTAVTFPVQSIIFLMIALAATPGPLTKDQITNRLKGRVRVYGDDIIIPSSGYDNLRRLMTLLELKVNDSKSFVSGHFRESCGTDMYRGYDVTPVKPKRLSASGPEHVQAVIEYANNAFEKGLWSLSNYFLHSLPTTVSKQLAVRRVRRQGSVYCFSGDDFRHLRVRWSKDLCRAEVRCLKFSEKKTSDIVTDSPSLLTHALHTISRNSLGGREDVQLRRKLRMKLGWEPILG